MINGELNKEQFRQLQEALKKLDLPSAKRHRLLWRMAQQSVMCAISSRRRVISGRRDRPGVRQNVAQYAETDPHPGNA